MNYKKIYDEIIERSRLRGLNKSQLNFISEKHHIIPECLGGLNEKSNYVLLKLKEHIICHHLLCKIYPKNNSLIYAYNMMVHTRVNGIHLSAKQYEIIKTQVSKAKTGHFVSKETREKIKLKRLGQRAWNAGKVGIQIAWNKGLSMKETTREKMSKSRKNKIRQFSSNRVNCKIDDNEFCCLKDAYVYAKEKYNMNANQAMKAFIDPNIKNFIKLKNTQFPKNAKSISINGNIFSSKRHAYIYVKNQFNIGGCEMMKRIYSDEWPSWIEIK